ncbi:MAG: hypothetical protein OEZ39_04025 [Gammaproteobacteria bacterium]|nr:hypothetical protein [Gammaproteobacteria bacterium]MDH5651025.1 hypothetical protein [Gammaproteobacteria bacterium]
MAMRIGADIASALNALDREVSLAKNTASLAAYNDKRAKAELEEVESAETEPMDDDSRVGQNLDVEA